MPYFDEPVSQNTNNQLKFSAILPKKRLIRDLLSNTPNCSVCASEIRGYLFTGMHEKSTRSGTELARKIQLTDWSTAGNLSNRSSGVQIARDICTRFGRYLYSTKCS